MKASVPFTKKIAAALVVLLATAVSLGGLFWVGARTMPEDPSAEAPPVAVSVLALSPETVKVEDVLPGRVVALRTAEVRPQVGGIVQSRLFEQGSDVKAGQLLFQLNPAPFAAEVANAQATLARAEAASTLTRAQAEREKRLVEVNAVSRQSYDSAVAAAAQAVADVAQARAALDRRRLDLEFASVTAPISGRIGRELVSEGALVGQAASEPMAIIQQIDQVYIDVRQPASHMDAWREATQQRNADARVINDNNVPYPDTARLLFSDISVDPGTGSLILRLQMDNSRSRLLPGQFVRVRLTRDIIAAALVVPEQAVQRDGAGNAILLIADERNLVASRPVVLGPAVSGGYVVSSGVRAGERVIVEGYERVVPNATVTPHAWTPVAQAAGQVR